MIAAPSPECQPVAVARAQVRDTFSPVGFRPYLSGEDLDAYKVARDADCRAQRIQWVRSGPTANSQDQDGHALYRVNETGHLIRTRPLSARIRCLVLERDSRACTKCGSTAWLQVDHIVRYVDGGSDDLENLRTLCERCHRKRGRRS